MRGLGDTLHRIPTVPNVAQHDTGNVHGHALACLAGPLRASVWGVVVLFLIEFQQTVLMMDNDRTRTEPSLVAHLHFHVFVPAVAVGTFKVFSGAGGSSLRGFALSSNWSSVLKWFCRKMQ